MDRAGREFGVESGATSGTYPKRIRVRDSPTLQQRIVTWHRHSTQW